MGPTKGGEGEAEGVAEIQREECTCMHLAKKRCRTSMASLSRRGESSRSRVMKCELVAQEFAKSDHREDLTFRRHPASFCGKAVDESKCKLGRAKMDTHGV